MQPPFERRHGTHTHTLFPCTRAGTLTETVATRNVRGVTRPPCRWRVAGASWRA